MPERPDPEELLKCVQDAESRAARARLKVFFGAAPGVGKTYAMLQEAQRRQMEGVDVLVGVVETHRREDTAALAEGLPVLPRKSVAYRGVTLEEFDLEAALARRPTLILMDELAHTNAPGGRHAKRWQDVMELLDAGIDVYSTLNVQHLESLREVVAQITGVVVHERIPDTVLERCDEMELVDISVEELTQRLQEGKVYVPDQARHAIQRFFRRGNLLALRELALRRMAELVDADMHRYRAEAGIRETWAAGERLLVGITPRPSAAALIRETRRLADALGASWMAVFVDYGHPMSDTQREQLESHLRLVERLGGKGIVLPGHGTPAGDLLTLARSRNATQILVGRSARSWWQHRFQGDPVDELMREAGSIHIHVLPLAAGERPATPPRALPASWPGMGTLGLCTLYVGLATLVALAAFRHMELADLVMIFILPILVAAVRYGRNAAVATSILSVLSLDFFFIAPRFTLAVGDVRHMGTFAVMLGMGVVIGNLTERVRQQAIRAQQREQRTLALYRLGEALVQAGDQAETIAAAVRAVEAQFRTQVAFYLPRSSGRVEPLGFEGHTMAEESNRGVAQWAFDHNQPAGQGTGVLPASRGLFLPLKGARGTLGVMALQTEEGPLWQEPDQRHLLESFANQAALALERANLSAEAQASRIHMERESLRSTLLSSVSHDLRTPLAGITGSATTLLEAQEHLSPEEVRGLLTAIQDEAFRMHRLVGNLLDLTRLESSAMEPRREWIPASEVFGSALSHLGRQAEGRDIRITLEDPDLLFHADPTLVEQLLLNLLENALKFSTGPVELKAYAGTRATTLLVADLGPGIPEGFETRIFDKLFRAPGQEGTPGAGLGLAICQAIARAHEGTIHAANRPQGGAQFVVSLPHAGDPPARLIEETDA